MMFLVYLAMLLEPMAVLAYLLSRLPATYAVAQAVFAKIHQADLIAQCLTDELLGCKRNEHLAAVRGDGAGRRVLVPVPVVAAHLEAGPVAVDGGRRVAPEPRRTPDAERGPSTRLTPSRPL